MNIETLIGIAGAFGGLEALKWLASLKSSRRKAAAEAAESMETALAKRIKTYEESIIFLQNQLREKEVRFNELSLKYEEATSRVIDLTRKQGELKLKYASSRCDRKDCAHRKPPFRWMKTVASVIIAATVLSSCTKKIYVPVEKETVRIDSLRKVETRRDSVVFRDTFLQYERGDTVFRDVVRWRIRTALERDTVYLARHDTVIEPKIVEVEKGGGSAVRRSLWLLLACALAVYFVINFLRDRFR